MRKLLALLCALPAAALVVGWMSGYVAVSVVPGWHTPILSPHLAAAILVSAVLLAASVVLLVRRGRE